jgi:hypothetical protein
MTLKGLLFTIIIFTNLFFAHAQSSWKSPNYKYSVEIPYGFHKTKPIGQNVDFKAEKENSSILVVVKTLSAEYAAFNIWEMLGDLSTYGSEWEMGAREYMNDPKFLKYGTTSIDGKDTFWYDYTAESPKMYSKTYQTLKGRNVITFTLTSPTGQYNLYSSIWFRFKENIHL